MRKSQLVVLNHCKNVPLRKCMVNTTFHLFTFGKTRIRSFKYCLCLNKFCTFGKGQQNPRKQGQQFFLILYSFNCYHFLPLKSFLLIHFLKTVLLKICFCIKICRYQYWYNVFHEMDQAFESLYLKCFETMNFFLFRMFLF